MCKVTKKAKYDKFTGYKLVVKKNGKYYSPVMGIEYKVGEKVTPVIKYEDVLSKNISNNWLPPSWILSKDSMFYEKKMIGKTGVLVNLEDAKSLNHHRLGERIVRMTISGNLHHAVLNKEHKTIVGEFIESIEEI